MPRRVSTTTIHILLLLYPSNYSLTFSLPSRGNNILRRFTTNNNLAFFQNAKGTNSNVFSINSRSNYYSSSLSSSSKSNSAQLKMAHMDSPSAQRNKGPIWSVLKDLIPKLLYTSSTTTEHSPSSSFHVLEIAAGVGVHTLHFTTQTLQQFPNIPNFKWYASDPDETSLQSIQSRIQSCATTNTTIQQSIHSPPLSITLCQSGIQNNKDEIDAIVIDGNINLMICINMIHISPWEATIGLFKVASMKLKNDGILYCYGPYKENGTAVESNL